ncbi:MAG TPA: chemotaxis protein, partial [Thiothrix sp.]|nr:chemotaxis protein [Thiothrix sp.]
MPATYQNDSQGGLSWLPIMALIVFIGCMVVAFEYAAVENSKTQRYLSLLSEQSLLSQQIAASTSQSVLLDGTKAFEYIKELRDKFDANLKLIREVDPDFSEKYQTEVALLDKEWKVYREKVDMILFGQKIISDTKKHAESINQLIPSLHKQSEKITRRLLNENLPAKQIVMVARQSMLLQRIDNNLNRVLSGDKDVEAAAEQFASDTEEFGQVINALLKGNSTKNITAVKQKSAIRLLKETSTSFREVSETISTILDVAPALNKLSNASFSIETQSRILLRAILKLKDKLQEREEKNALYKLGGFVFGALALLTAILLGYLLFKQARKRIKFSSRQHEKQQAAIVQLLEEMNTLAEGDLTIRATVTESITGAIADSVNYAVEALRILVTKINNTSGELTRYASNADKNIQLLSASSQQQKQKIDDSSRSISALIDSIKQVSKNASSSAEVAQKSLEISHAGAATVRDTITGMSAIREQIQSTSKRIKRLSESSQEIGKIVHLMNEIAEQTNVLALNAAIQASAAKTQNNSQNFSALSDEVQQLSLDASEATRKIEVLVKAILADTEEAVVSMELTTANVVDGTRNAENAKDSLNEIENVSTQLAELIAGISAASVSQSDAAEQIAEAIAS